MLLVQWIGLRHKNIVTNDLISDILTCLARVVGHSDKLQERKMSLKLKTLILCRQMQSDYQQKRIQLISTLLLIL